MNDFFKHVAAQHEAERQTHIRPEIRALVARGTPITQTDLDEWFKTNGMNSWEREFVYPHLDNEALLNQIEHCLSLVGQYHPRHKGFRPSATYDAAMTQVFVPLMLDRFRALIKGTH